MRKIGLFALTLLITGSIDSIRNLPSTALSGSALVFFVAFAGLVFLMPTALVSAELAANIDEGGVYQWARLAFGERVGFLAVWLQWINNIFWFPTILSFIVGTAAYLIDPALAQNKYYLVGAILGVFWLLTFINLKGVHISARFSSFCTIVGLIIPMLFIITLCGVWLALHKPTQIHLSLSTIWPQWDFDHWNALTVIMLSFTGMELTTVHIKEVHQPQRAFPRALGVSSLIILFTMALGSLAVAFVLPYNQINLVNGTIQTFAYFLSAYQLNWLTPVLTLLLVVGSLGGLMNWVSGPIKGIAEAAEHGFLPPFFRKHNRHHAPKNLLLMQAILVSIVCTAFLMIPNINGSFWLLMALATQLYMLMYVLVFLSAWRLRHRIRNEGNAFRIPGGKLGTRFTCILGLVGCFMTLCVGFVPPTYMTNHFNYELMFAGGMIAMLLPLAFFYWYQGYTKRIVSPTADTLQPLANTQPLS
jgi:amino acid transporter